MKNILKTAFVLALVLTVSGCATPRGQYYGNMGGLAGAAIGAAAGGWQGAIIGGATGAAAGGLYGDEQSYRWQKDQADYYNSGDANYRDYRYQGAPYGSDCNACNQNPSSGYVKPCHQVYMPVYDRYGNVVGQRLECQ